MTQFDPLQGLIIVTTRLVGPAGEAAARLALDSGASSTLINKAILELIGYLPDTLPKTVTFTTGSQIEYAPRVPVEKLEALNQERLLFPVIAHTLPPSASIDGLLGLDFFRNRVLNLDFVTGVMSLT